MPISKNISASAAEQPSLDDDMPEEIAVSISAEIIRVRSGYVDK